MTDGIRVQKVLADAGVASRRAAEALVVAGRVAVNGQPAVIGQRIDPQRDRLTLDGRPVIRSARHAYLVVNKPAGFTSTVSDRHAERTVLELVPEGLVAPGTRLYPVGRLDRDSEGLLLLTDDGDWTQRVLHPRYQVEREYAVAVREPLRPEQERALGDGIALEEGVARLTALRRASRTEAHLVTGDGPGAGRTLVWYRAVLTQGWKRQLRRMFAAVGAPVERLVRVRIGTLRMGSLAPGAVRALSAAERDRLGLPGRPTAAASRGREPGPAHGEEPR
jgi:23S rRNA pseudouridine2605 synthase